jgi:hypothetical protein
MGIVDLKSKLNEFKGVNTPDNPYDRNKPTQLSDSVKSSGRSGGVRPSIRTFAKGLEMFGIGSVPIGDTYEDKIKQDSIFSGNETLNNLNKGISAFKSIKKSIKSFSDNPLKSISDLANADQEFKLTEYRAKAYGKQKKLGNPAAKIVLTDRKVANSFEGPIKGGKKSRNVNHANMTPYGEKGKDTDLIDFYFKDIHNDKYIRFGALLSGISDTITPEYASERYLGRPESVYIYQGVSRALSFTFDVYPTTRQELPVLWEKVNFLVGMCYPNWVSLGGVPVGGEDLGAEPITMQSPLTELTIGDLYRDTPGYLSSVGITVQDGSTWEFEDNLQLPHHIQIGCEFVYIGKYLPSSRGKHFELNWLTDKNDKYGTFDWGDGTEGSPEVLRKFGMMDWLNSPMKTTTKSEMVDKGRWNTYSGIESEDDDLADDLTIEEV